jgi:predicted nucleic acid-binding protein
VIVLDTSVVIAFMDRAEPAHAEVGEWMVRTTGPLVTTPLALAEMDYLVSRFGGASAAQALRETLASGAYGVTWWDDALATTLALASGPSHVGLTDASLVALAARLGTTRVATLDERRFRSLRPLTGEPGFILLPADADYPRGPWPSRTS